MNNFSFLNEGCVRPIDLGILFPETIRVCMCIVAVIVQSLSCVQLFVTP